MITKTKREKKLISFFFQMHMEAKLRKHHANKQTQKPQFIPFPILDFVSRGIAKIQVQPPQGNPLPSLPGNPHHPHHPLRPFPSHPKKLPLTRTPTTPPAARPIRRRKIQVPHLTPVLPAHTHGQTTQVFAPTTSIRVFFVEILN